MKNVVFSLPAWARRTLFVAILPAVGISCSKDVEVKTKDVSFKVATKCSDLVVSDYYNSRLVNSVHKVNVDTAWIEFADMVYGRHELELSINGRRQGCREFFVTDSTARAYLLYTVNMGIQVDSAWAGIIDYRP